MMQAWRALMTAHRRPVVDYAVGLALVGMAAFFIINPLDNGTSRTATNVSSTLNTAPIQAPYSKAEIDRAKQRAVEAFDRLSAAGRKAAHTVQNQLRGATSPVATRPASEKATSDRAPEQEAASTPQDASITDSVTRTDGDAGLEVAPNHAADASAPTASTPTTDR